MNNMKRFILGLVLLSLASVSSAQSRDLLMEIWKAKDNLSISKESLEKVKGFKEEKTDILSQIKKLEDGYFQKLENDVNDDKLKNEILKLYKQKHHLIDEIKHQAIQNKDEALFLELIEHVRPKDLIEMLKIDQISEIRRDLYKTWLEAIRSTAIGSQLKDFILLDQNGEQVNTAKFKGKIFWIDSWASKCGPCIKKLKQIKPIYKSYHSEGFEILALSWDYTKHGYIKTMDAAKNDWLKVMKKHEFNWLNVFDEGDEIMEGLFGSVGKNILVDENGIVIGFDLHPLEIEQILEH